MLVRMRERVVEVRIGQAARVMGLRQRQERRRSTGELVQRGTHGSETRTSARPAPALEIRWSLRTPSGIMPTAQRPRGSTVDIPRHFVIRERNHRIHNPFDEAKLATLGRALRLPAGTRVLDLCCGSGEMLCTWARDLGMSGVGVDLSPD